MIKLLIVDDHPFIRSAIKSTLQAEKKFEFYEASNGPEALELSREINPDLIILDISIPLLDGIEVMHRLKRLHIRSKVLILTSLPSLFYASRSMNAGASGFISKSNNIGDLSKAITMLLSGYSFYPDLADDTSIRKYDQLSDSEIINSLTNKELLILQKLSQGYSNKEIGKSMLLSNKTISTYKAKLFEKLSVKSTVALADFSRKNGVV